MPGSVMWAGLILCAWLAPGSPVNAADAPPPTPSSIARVEAGVTGWFSQGQTVWSHNASGLDPDLGNPTSKLKYKDTGTNVVEFNARVELRSRLFVRGSLGFGEIGGGRLTDDDFLSARGAAAEGSSVSGAHRFSSTQSDLSGNNLWFVSGDVGAVVKEFGGKRGRFDLFAGFQYWREKLVATGVTQTACTTASLCPPAGTVRFSGQSVIANTTQWVSGRLGGEVDYQFDPRVSLNFKAAMLLSYLDNEDTHYLRTDLAKDPSFRMTGGGIGTNTDISLRVRIIERLYLSGGYRLWWNRVLFSDQWKIYAADGSTSSAPLTKFESLRHGPTISLTYTF